MDDKYKKRIQLLKYLFEISTSRLFIVWKITFHLTYEKVFLYYKQNWLIKNSIEIEYNFNKIWNYNDWYKKTKDIIENFILDSYYYNEYNWDCLTLRQLWELLGIEEKNVERRIWRIVSFIMFELWKKTELNNKSVKIFKEIINLFKMYE